MTKEEYRKSYAVRLASIELKIANAAANNDLPIFMEATGELARLSVEVPPEFDDREQTVAMLRKRTTSVISESGQVFIRRRKDELHTS